MVGGGFAAAHRWFFIDVYVALVLIAVVTACAAVAVNLTVSEFVMNY